MLVFQLKKSLTAKLSKDSVFLYTGSQSSGKP